MTGESKMIKPAQLRTILAVSVAFLEAILPEGSPSGIIFSCFSSYEMSLYTYNDMIEALKHVKAIEVRGNVIYRGEQYELSLAKFKRLSEVA